jgi:uncharacterized membrane protein HdeD (DUF308 family)
MLTDFPPAPATPPHSLGEAIERLRARWPWLVGFGAFCLCLGAVALALVAVSTLAVVFFISIMLVMAGGAEIVLGFGAHGWRSALFWVVSGLFYLVVGAYGLARPQEAAVFLTIFAGFGFIFAGVARIVLGFRLPAGPKAYVALAGVVTLLLGVLIVGGWPGDTPLVLGTLFGVDLVFYGASWIALGLKLRS